MTLKAVLFDFNGVIINDESLHKQLIHQLLLEENLRPDPALHRQFCLGRSDRSAIRDLLASQERYVSEAALQKLVARKAERYHQALVNLDPLPIFAGVQELVERLQAANLCLAVVSGAVLSEIEFVLQKAQLRPSFSVVVGGDELLTSKPEPDGYKLAIARLNQAHPNLALQPNECLALEDTPAGIQAAKRAGISVVGVANTYPFRMMHRQANWVIDRINDLDLDHLYWYFNRDHAA